MKQHEDPEGQSPMHLFVGIWNEFLWLGEHTDDKVLKIVCSTFHFSYPWERWPRACGAGIKNQGARSSRSFQLNVLESRYPCG